MKRTIALTVLVTFAACSGDKAPTVIGSCVPATAPTPAPTSGPSIPVSFLCGTVTANLATTVAARDTGLMHVNPLGANSGMLFVFRDSSTVGFWMKDTPISLSIAFIGTDMRVITLSDMAANSTDVHFAARPYKYALEVNEGWFASHGVVVGTLVTFTLPAGTNPDP